MGLEVKTPLLPKDTLIVILPPPPVYFVSHVSTWEVWNPTSPSFRFYLLVLLSLVPFSGHFVTNQMGALQQLMLDDATFPITNTMYGALNSAVAIPNMFIPFFGGHVLDATGHLSLLVFLVVMSVGHAVVTYAMAHETFWLAIAGRILFGIGEGSVVVGARAMVSFWFDTTELTFAMAVMVAFTSVSKMLAKATVAPVALYFGSYIYGLLYGLGICILSCVFGVKAMGCIHRLKCLKMHFRDADAPMLSLDPALPWLNAYLCTQRNRRRTTTLVDTTAPTLAALAEFPLKFWVLVVLHVVFVNVFHLFQNISSAYLYQEHGYSIVESGMMSSTSHLLVLFSPLVGLLIDCVGGRVVVILLSASLGIVAYGLLLFTSVTPLVSLLLISFCLASTPAVLMACVPLTIPKTRYGLAFGIVQVIDAIGSTAGNLLVGYLRDTTGSYTADMVFFFGLAWLLLFLCILLACLDLHSGRLLLSAAAHTRRRPSICDDADPCVDIGRSFHEPLSSDEEGDETIPAMNR
ncbi:Aste57867_25248 [Aphanomyces stellatus]|uniref:Lysosomal dipeptide transporter MFSD1 n=1 Tax=Aphanomyces stellatus TaxID=120398 RepID=A0A485LV13_9STRA|nr:hypothetical protein As57867_025170 [Aphanomyces stellatus]VFU01874.1 Aste57867_25248 [Aphanomyces stellatus]